MASVEPLGFGPFYDLHVPGEEHYFAHGLIHHNTSKTYPLQAIVHLDCLRNPGARWRLMRAERSSMTDTVLEKPWESQIIKADLESRKVTIEGGRQRLSYRYKNGSVVYPRGLDAVGKAMSGAFRGLLLHEVTPGPDGSKGITEEQFSYMLTRVGREERGFVLLECNPSTPDHWANRWADQGRIRRFLSRHHHNPLYATAEALPDGRTAYHWTSDWWRYFANIDQLVGPARDRLLLHKWVAAVGLVLPEFDPALHRLSRARFESIQKQRWKVAWLAQDWGFEAPGCLQLWLGTNDGEAYRVWEVMYREKYAPWWAERVSELVRWCEKEYGLRPATIECDHDKDNVAVYNRELSRHGWNAVAREVSKGPGSVQAGLDIFRQWLRPKGPHEYVTRVYFVEDAAWCGLDPSLKERGWAQTTEAQLMSYVWAETKDGRPVAEEPHPGCRDDGIDCARYALTWAHRTRLHLPAGDGAGKKAPAQGTYEWNLEQERRAVHGEKPLASRRDPWPSVHGGQTHNRR